MYLDNYKTLKEKNDVITNKWKHILFKWLGRMNIVKMGILPTEFYRLNAVSVKIPVAFFHRTRADNSNIYVEPQKSPDSYTALEKEERS